MVVKKSKMNCCEQCRSSLMEELRLSGRLKEIREEKRLVLPYNNEKNESKCESLRYEHGLYVQCSREKLGEKYCERCEKEKLRGINYGNIEERMKVGIMEYVDPKGRKVVHYRKVMKKLKISELDVNKECAGLNINLVYIHMEEVKSKRGRPAKEKKEEEKVEKRGRGRPRKEKKEEEITGENMIEKLINDRDKEEEKKEETEETEEEEETEVCEFILKEKKYLKSGDNILYDIESHEILGKWIEETNTIEEYED